MIPERIRLPHDRIRSVSHSMRKTGEAGLFVSAMANTLPFARFSFIVPKSASKLAVHRNRMRRMLGESVRTLPQGAYAGFDFVFVARRDFSHTLTADIAPLVRALCARLAS